MGNARGGGQTNTNAFFDESKICLFQLTDAGTILYCRNTPPSKHDLTKLVGRNLFEEIAPFENTEELRRHFNRFIKNDFSTENFSFTCRVKNRNIRTKIMLVRISERSFGEGDKTTIIDIRKA